MAVRRKFGVGRTGAKLNRKQIRNSGRGGSRTAAQKAAQIKAAKASAAKRRGTGRPKVTTYKGDSRGRKGNGNKTFTRTETPKPSRRIKRIDKKIAKVKSRNVKKVGKQADKVQRNTYTNGTDYLVNKRGAKAYNKGVKIHNKNVNKTAKLKAKKKAIKGKRGR